MMFPTIDIGCKIEKIRDLNDFVVERCKGKSVLNIGAAGNMGAYLPDRADLSTHMKAAKVASDIFAIDIDREAIDHAAGHGVAIHYADCQDFDLGRQFDTVLWLEVIEHLDRPGDALHAAMRHLKPGGQLLLTTFNATFAGGFLDGILRRDMGVYHDHVACYMPEHIKALTDRHGYRLTEVYFYTMMNRFWRSAHIKSYFLKAIGTVAPRLSNAFVAIIEHRGT
jgi:SAM-dependent methyltransferase